MSLTLVLEAQPPSPSALARRVSVTAVDRVIAVTHLPARARAAVIGRHTLPFVIALMDRGCACVRSLRPDVAMPDCEAVDLAWIVDVASEPELDWALEAARRRTGGKGRVVVEGSGCLSCRAIERRARTARLDVISFDHRAQRVVLAATTPLAMAA
ncbi:hypothetical protein SAMN02745126_05288 [Enhydrobacter aerosaccus]|uniref:Uncharacterized protein n=1 Tax=Enhydrobacter aerosaccus TaxID=225324 RepID=A0A1T4SWU9_9HYPH|nr:hypothetical protein [Enhydrobacter aerosaccus]SKA32626.1 hypothetical protein SAMN02745126_05288 [Enhydrobacter aerosaccus]